MRFTAFAIFVAVGLAAAQTTTSSAAAGASTCLAQPTVDNCLDLEKPKVAACTGNDWDCLCQAQQQLVTCYNNCPGAADGVTAQQQEQTWCNAAKLYGSSALASQSSTASGSANGTMAASSATATSSAAATTTSGSGIPMTMSGAGSSASSTASAASAADRALPAGGFFAMVMGALALL